MTDITLRNKIVVFTGPPDSGKSNLVKWLLTQPEYRSHLVYDPLFGFDPDLFNVIRPPDRSTKWRRYEDGNPELNEAVDRFVIGAGSEHRPSFFVVDEAGRLLPNNKPVGAAMGELNDFNAHYGISLWVVGQRLAQINTDLENKATHYFVMGYQGKNDRRALANVHTGLPDALDNIKHHDPYGFAYVGPNNTLSTFRSVEKVGKKSMI